MKKHPREKGQVLVLIILAIVGLFGFAALAVDGGRYFAERRRAQNAADASAFAAAYAGATWQDWSAAGISSTTLNGYDDTDPNENAGADQDVRVHHPPVRGRYATATENIDPDEFYQVIIRYRVDQVFSQIVYSGDLWVEVEAVVRGTEQRGFPYGAAIVATCRTCCDGLNFSGTGDIVVTGGNVISNSGADGSSSCCSINRDGTAVVDISGGELVAGGELCSDTKKECKHPDGTVGPCLTSDGIDTFTENPDTYKYPYEPSCSGLSTVSKFKYTKSETLSPGIYPDGIQVTGKGTVLTLNPGMYCLGGDFSVTSGSVIGSNIMVFMQDGSVNIQTNEPVNLLAPTEEENCIADPEELKDDCWSGFLFYMKDENDGTIFLGGGGSTNYTGTIYAVGPPHSGYKCTFVGSSVETTLDASIICYTVNVVGTNGLNVNYDDNLNAQSPGALELME